jgi:hypothetical protein
MKFPAIIIAVFATLTCDGQPMPKSDDNPTGGVLEKFYRAVSRHIGGTGEPEMDRVEPSFTSVAIYPERGSVLAKAGIFIIIVYDRDYDIQSVSYRAGLGAKNENFIFPENFIRPLLNAEGTGWKKVRTTEHGDFYTNSDQTRFARLSSSSLERVVTRFD